MQIQSDYAKRVYENHMAELKKLGEMCVGTVRDTTKPVEDASRSSDNGSVPCQDHSKSKLSNAPAS
jgi:hypothetical protein